MKRTIVGGLIKINRSGANSGVSDVGSIPISNKYQIKSDPKNPQVVKVSKGGRELGNFPNAQSAQEFAFSQSVADKAMGVK